MSGPAKLDFIPDIVTEHFDELQFLWRRRRTALRSPTDREREIVALEERVEAHADAMLVIGDRLREYVDDSLAADDEMPAFAAAFVLLRQGAPGAATRVADVFEGASGKKLHGVAEALASASATTGVAPRLTTLFLSGGPRVAAAAGEVLAFRGAVRPDRTHLERLLRAEDPAVRAAAWRLAALSGAALPTSWYDVGLGDPDVGVTRAAVTAAAWAGAPAFALHCHRVASTPDPESLEALRLFAAAAPPEEYQLVGAVASAPAWGPERFGVVGAFAHPYFIDLLIQEMSNPDPAAAAAAGRAFTKMTGRDVESTTRVKVSPDGKPPADDFEAEFMDEVFLPNPDLARAHWQELAPQLAHAPRICRGMDVSRPLSREEVAALDRESLWEYCLRARLFSGWQGTPLVLERYPQRF